jgi:hypothetical protein
MAGVAESDDPVEAVARLGARLIMQPALEDEVTEFRGRARYERADADGGAAIYRNGYEPRTVKTTSGSMALERLRIRHAAELGSRAGCSRLSWPGARRELEPGDVAHAPRGAENSGATLGNRPGRRVIEFAPLASSASSWPLDQSSRRPSSMPNSSSRSRRRTAGDSPRNRRDQRAAAALALARSTNRTRFAMGPSRDTSGRQIRLQHTPASDEGYAPAATGCRRLQSPGVSRRVALRNACCCRSSEASVKRRPPRCSLGDLSEHLGRGRCGWDVGRWSAARPCCGGVSVRPLVRYGPVTDALTLRVRCC